MKKSIMEYFFKGTVGTSQCNVTFFMILSSLYSFSSQITLSGVHVMQIKFPCLCFSSSFAYVVQLS